METRYGHLTYCTNIHAGESWPDHFAALKHYFPLVKQKVSPSIPMGIGLRLSHLASTQLHGQSLNEFKEWLVNNQAYVFTMNGFPYGGFHHTRVKDQVHAPDWTTPQRVDYTLRLFEILHQLLPAGMDGGISTSPLSYRHWFGEGKEKTLQQATELATRNVAQVAAGLIIRKNESGQVLHLDIEPEPDGILENGDEYIYWFTNWLLPIGREVLHEQLGADAAEADELIKEHIRLCYDVCHFAVGYENHAAVISQLNREGLKIGKFQISAALKSALPVDEAGRNKVKEAFSVFNESTYLHQVVARQNDGSLLRYPDMAEALAAIHHPQSQEWRAHFHVPIFEEDFKTLRSTQADIVTVLELHKTTPQTHHLEVETYTWEVLPDKLKLPLHESIIRELNWMKKQLNTSTTT